MLLLLDEAVLRGLQVERLLLWAEVTVASGRRVALDSARAVERLLRGREV